MEASKEVDRTLLHCYRETLRIGEPRRLKWRQGKAGAFIWEHRDGAQGRSFYDVVMSDTLIRALAQGHEVDWTLDRIGNWTTYTEDAVVQNRTHNLGNELTQINGSASHIQHNAAGNMTFVPKVGAETTAHWTMTYDAWNRIATVKDGTTLIAEYRYDADNKRIAKIVPNGSNWRRTDYFHDGTWRVLEERHANSQVSKETVPALVKCQYVWDARYLDACAVRWRDGNDDGDFLDANEVLYYLHDAHFNVTVLVDPAGTVQERYAYEPYGLPKIADARWIARAVSSFDNQILFSGYRWDTEDQMYHVRNRYYHPTLGRWVTRDPIGESDGPHFYIFAANCSLQYLDATGLTTTDTSDREIVLDHFTVNIDQGETTGGFWRSDTDFASWVIRGSGLPEGSPDPALDGGCRTREALPTVSSPERSDCGSDCVKRRVITRGSAVITIRGRTTASERRLRSARTVLQHEQRHAAVALAYYRAYNTALKQLANTCRTPRCDTLFSNMFDKWVQWATADRLVGQWENEVADYEGRYLDVATRLLGTYTEQRTAANTDFERALTEYVTSCH